MLPNYGTVTFSSLGCRNLQICVLKAIPDAALLVQIVVVEAILFAQLAMQTKNIK